MSRRSSRFNRSRSGRNEVALIGRQREVAQLEAELDRVLQGQLRVILITGGPGVGKTRLARELTERHDSVAEVLSARSYRLGATASFGPWMEALDRHLHSQPVAEVERIVGGAAAQLEGYLSVLGLPGDDHQPERGRLLEGLTEVLRRLTEDRPVLVSLDDIHLADFSSWEALRYLSRRLTARPLGIVLTARPLELRTKAIASEILIGLEDDGLLAALDLEPLSPETLAQLAAAALDRSPAEIPTALVRWLAERSLGHPLFAIGLLDALLEEGARLDDPHLDRIPESLRERVAMELRALPAQDRGVLEVLSVFEQATGAHHLTSILGITIDELSESLQRLVGSGFVAEHVQGRTISYELAHPLIQETIYQSMIGARRQSLHRSIARVLQSEGRTAPAAAHFAKGSFEGDTESVAALCAAMREAEESGLYQEALAILGALLEILPRGDDRWNQVLDAMRWQADWVVGHLAESNAGTAVEAMRRIQAAVGDADAGRMANVMLHLASFLSIGAAQLD